MGVENLYSDFNDDALFGYLTYICFLLSGQKSSLSNVGGCGEAQVCTLSSVRSHLLGHNFPICEMGTALKVGAGPPEKEADLLFQRADLGNGSELCCDMGRHVDV